MSGGTSNSAQNVNGIADFNPTSIDGGLMNLKESLCTQRYKNRPQVEMKACLQLEKDGMNVNRPFKLERIGLQNL